MHVKVDPPSTAWILEVLGEQMDSVASSIRKVVIHRLTDLHTD